MISLVTSKILFLSSSRIIDPTVPKPSLTLPSTFTLLK